MPELPEVETTRRGIAPYLESSTIQAIHVHEPRLRWPVSEQLINFQAQAVQKVERRGKYILLEFEDGAIIAHLGMSGSLRLVESNTARKKHDHIEFILSSGKVLRFNDPRRFGCMLWTDDWRQHELIRHLGPEPLDEVFNGDYLYEQSRGRKTSIKQFVMNGQLVVGVGNIYANEALFMSGISPTRQAGRISRDRYQGLAENIKIVLRRSIEQGGTTLRDFVNSDGMPGYFKQQLFVYGRGGEPCKHCGSILKELRQNNRASVFCGSCQR